MRQISVIMNERLEEKNVLTLELRKLMENLENDVENIEIDSKKLLKELHDLDNMLIPLSESLALSNGVCHTCGRPL